MTKPQRRLQNAGFSLLELMITIAIVGILAAVAIPNFRDFILDNRRAALVNELLASMSLARSEAGKRGRTVVLCGIVEGGGATCRTSSETDWSYGWLAYVNTDGVTPVELNTGAGDLVLQQFINTQRSYKLKATESVFSFRAFNVSSTNGNVKVCDPRDKDTGTEKSRAVIVDPSGRARVDKTDGSGNPLLNNC